MMNCVSYGVVAVFIGSFLMLCEAKLKEGDCDVCIKFLTQFDKSLESTDRSHPDVIKEKLLKTCKTTKGKDNRFCYYIGGMEDSATRVLKEITQPMKNFVPAEIICEKLKAKVSQICELEYEQKIDIRNQDLKKMRVKQLRKVLQSWDEDCPGCIEKTDFVERIEELKHKHMEL